MDDLINKIAAQTGIPAETVTPVVGAILAHMGDVLPAPLAHQIAVMLGIHQEDGEPDSDESSAQPSAGGFGTSGTGENSFAGATSLMNLGQSLLGGFLSKRR